MTRRSRSVTRRLRRLLFADGVRRRPPLPRGSRRFTAPAAWDARAARCPPEPARRGAAPGGVRGPRRRRRRRGHLRAGRARASRASCCVGHGTASPVVQAGGMPAATARSSSAPRALSQSDADDELVERQEERCAATIIPRMPMKRVSSPTRIASSDDHGEAERAARSSRRRSGRCPAGRSGALGRALSCAGAVRAVDRRSRNVRGAEVARDWLTVRVPTPEPDHADRQQESSPLAESLASRPRCPVGSRAARSTSVPSAAS